MVRTHNSDFVIRKGDATPKRDGLRRAYEFSIASWSMMHGSHVVDQHVLVPIDYLNDAHYASIKTTACVVVD